LQKVLDGGVFYTDERHVFTMNWLKCPNQLKIAFEVANRKGLKIPIARDPNDNVIARQQV